LKTENEANIERFFCIVELEANNSRENQPIDIAQDD
jgi:hypothetical protein